MTKKIKATYLNKSITKVDPISTIIGSGKMTVERLRVELGEDKNFVYTTINAVAHRNINKPVTPSNWHLGTRKKKKKIWQMLLRCKDMLLHSCHDAQTQKCK